MLVFQDCTIVLSGFVGIVLIGIAVHLTLYRRIISMNIFYLRFLSRTFIIHRTAGKGRRDIFNSSLPIPPASQWLRY